MHRNPFPCHLGADLRAARKAAGRTQTDLAQAAGVSLPTIRNAEGGRGTLETLAELADRLDREIGGRGLPPGGSLGERLAALRHRREIGQRGLAAMAGISPTSVGVRADRCRPGCDGEPHRGGARGYPAAAAPGRAAVLVGRGGHQHARRVDDPEGYPGAPVSCGRRAVWPRPVLALPGAAGTGEGEDALHGGGRRPGPPMECGERVRESALWEEIWRNGLRKRTGRRRAAGQVW